ncbi:PAS domain S-box protein, partial [Winogradskyella sp.]|uniref:PAS domain S-box protein n=1 Tax=Winogradskyella sp. TaxID=1883156 RepID=UPI003AA9E133
MKKYIKKSTKFIVIGYFIISCLYIVISDWILQYYYQENILVAQWQEIQSYKGVGFVFITATALFFILKRRDSLVEKQLKKLKENENSYYSLFNNMSHGIAYANPEGIITSVNQASLNILGVTEAEMVGSSVNSDEWKPVYEDNSGLSPEDHPGFEAIKTGKPVYNRVLGALNQETNTYKWLRLNSIPEFKHGESKPFRVCIIFTDISQLKNSQDELKLSQKVLKESLKKVEMSEFLLNEASKISKIGAYEFQNESGQWFFSDQVYKIFGLPKSN